MEITAERRQQIAALLGREPRGLEAIAVARANGQPMVIRVASLVADKPFPTMFWLIDRSLNYQIDTEEAKGLIAHFQQRIDLSGDLRQSMRADHLAHIALRDSYMSDATRAQMKRLGYGDVFAHRGIGGIADFSRIRCLHTWYASHLVVPNTVGELLDEHWRSSA